MQELPRPQDRVVRLEERVMRFNLCGNNNNGCGLQQDFEILKARLEELGHEVFSVQYGRDQKIEKVDVNIHIEMVIPHAFQYAQEQWSIPNPEWWIRNLWDRYRSLMKRFLCKTRDCQRIFEDIGPGRTELMGFRSQDQYLERTSERKFLHLVGRSQTKNTEAIIDAWKKWKISVPLTLVTMDPDFLRRAQGVYYIDCHTRVSEEDKRRMMNAHLFHLCPSKYEGWGHYIHEALSVGGVIITTDQPPMSEFAGIESTLRIPTVRILEHGAARLHFANPDDVHEAVKKALSLSEDEVLQIRNGARTAFESEQANFFTATERIFGNVKQTNDRPEQSVADARS